MPRKTLLLLLIAQQAIFAPLFSQTGEQLRANLYSFNTDSSLSLSDGNLTMYNINNSNAVDGMDAVKMSNFGENFGLLRGATTLAIERRHSITNSDTVFFKMWNMHQKNYKLGLILTGLAHPGLKGVLHDKYLNTTTALNLSGANNFVFTVTNDIASASPDRFRIIFSQLTSSFSLLPVTFTGIKAYHENNNIDVEWFVENANEISQYQIQKSENGQQFSTISTLALKGQNSSHYKWTDTSSVKGTAFYRIGSMDLNGKIQYSDITKVVVDLAGYTVRVYPNPVVNGSINIQFANEPQGIYVTRLINYNGQVISSKKVQHYAGNSSETMQVNKNMVKGNYVLEIITPDSKKLNTKILVQ